MSDRRTMTPADVPTQLVDAAERAINVATTEDPASELALRDALRTMLGIVLPMYEDRLGAELGRLTLPCPDHEAPKIGPDCIRCARYTALIGARRIIEGHGVYAGQVRRAALIHDVEIYGGVIDELHVHKTGALRESDDGTG